jgi:hypothetical protein
MDEHLLGAVCTPLAQPLLNCMAIVEHRSVPGGS